MHSLYHIQRLQKNVAEAELQQFRMESRNEEYHAMKTRELAANYEVRISDWLAHTERAPVEPIEAPLHVSQHKFRERRTELEIAHPNISPAKYTPERQRIDDTVRTQIYFRDRYLGESPNMARERDRSKDIQPTMRFKHRTDGERINAAISGNPVLPLQPWTRFDHPAMRKIRDEHPARWAAGPGRDFDRYCTDGVGPRAPPPRAFLFCALPYDDAAPLRHPHGKRRDFYRPRQPAREVAGAFRTIVPGYSADSLPGKWGMATPNSPSAFAPPPPLSAAALQSSSSFGGGGGGEGAEGLPGRGTPRHKTYWKASMEVAIGALQGGSEGPPGSAPGERRLRARSVLSRRLGASSRASAPSRAHGAPAVASGATGSGGESDVYASY